MKSFQLEPETFISEAATAETVLSQSSRDFDPEAHPELKRLRDPSEIPTRVNFKTSSFDPDKSYIGKFYNLARNYLESPTFDPERFFII